MIRKTLIIPVLCSLLSCYSSPFEKSESSVYSDSLDAFEYIDNFSEGLVLHYIKSNTDGSVPAQVDIYFPEPLRSESFKIYPGSRQIGAAYLVKAEYDPENFCILKVSGNYIRKNGDFEEYARLNIAEGRTVKVNVMGTEPYQFELMHTPSYVFNFDLADLNAMFRYIKDDTESLSAGIIGIMSNMEFAYSGTVEIKFEYDDKENSQLVYSIGGDGFNGRSGSIIVDKKDRYVKEYNIPMPTGNPYTGFLFKLQSVSYMSSDEWQDYILVQTKEALE